MFENLSERFQRLVKNLSGQARLTEENIKEATREVRVALLEADVALPIVTQFIDNITQKSLGQEVLTSLSPGQVLIKNVHDELVQLLGAETAELNLNAPPPAVVLLAGLQGAGKTTTAAKLANYLTQDKKKKILLVSTDVYRPAAIEQLKILSEELNLDFYQDDSRDPMTIAKNAIDHAKRYLHDIIILDTAGRLHIDNDMMAEIQELHKITRPIETLFVVDSMTGQDAAHSAKAFHQALPLTGVILTKVDGDARGGAALSVRTITGQPIKFIGMGEKLDALQPFHPERIASRILGMGDILTLVEQVQQKVDHQKAEKLAKKFRKGQDFDLEDFREQLQQMRNMGGIGSLLDKLPGMGMIPAQAKDKVNDKMFVSLEAMINSMTPHERRFPDVIRASRKQRIAKGSGTSVQEVNRLLKQFTQMQKMMKKMSKLGNLKNLMRGMGGLGGMGGMMPPGSLK